MINKTYYVAYMDWCYCGELPRFGWCWRSGTLEEMTKFCERNEFANAQIFDSYAALKRFILGDYAQYEHDPAEWIHLSE